MRVVITYADYHVSLSDNMLRMTGDVSPYKAESSNSSYLYNTTESCLETEKCSGALLNLTIIVHSLMC